MAFNNWPYTNFQDLNLGWILAKVTEALTSAAAAVAKANATEATVGTFDDRITNNRNAIEILAGNVNNIKEPYRVIVSSDLSARHDGNLVQGTDVYTALHEGQLPYVEYNGELYHLETWDYGNLWFCNLHVYENVDEVVLRRIHIYPQSSEVAYSIVNIDGGSGGNVFTVKISQENGEHVCDHTYAEIYSQMQNGRIPVLLVSPGGNPTVYEICGVGKTGTKTVSGQTVQEIEFVDPNWMIGNSNDVGVWTIDANNNIGHIASLKQLATLDNIVQFVNDGVTTNALLKTAQTLSAAEQAQVKQNLGISDSGGSYSPYVIPVTQSGGVYSTTATGEDVIDHILDCRIVFNNVYYYPVGAATSGPYGHAYFASVDPSASGKYDVEIFDVELNGDNACTVTRYEKDIVYNGAQPYLPINASAAVIPPLPVNTLVEFLGDASALNITLAQPSNNNISNEYHFIFTSGSTPTTLTIPNTVRQPDGFTVEANHVYEVSILNNNMTAQGWAVTP